MYYSRTAMLPGLLLVLMGSIDCATTVVGTVYFGASEMNPILAGVVSNVPLFMALKLTATFCIAGTTTTNGRKRENSGLQLSTSNH